LIDKEWRLDVRAAATTFLTMMYILIVNPEILSAAIKIEGVTDIRSQLLTATALSAAVGTFVMGIYARYPFALAPGMGLNAFFTFSVVLTMGVAWQTALGAVLIAGVIFILLTVSGVREQVVNAIPRDLKRAMAAGIGLFLAIIGFQKGGIVVDSSATLVTMGDIATGAGLLCLVGVIVTAGLMIRGYQTAILLGIVMMTAIAILTQQPVFAGKVFHGFEYGVMAWPRWPVDIMGQIRFDGLWSLEGISIIGAFLFVDFFDTAGTLMGVSEKAGFCDEHGRLPRAGRAYLADGIATTVGAVLGTSPTTTYIESAAGIEAGGRRGRVAVIISVMFLLSIFFWPLTLVVPGVATAPALIIIGALMTQTIRHIDWQKIHTSIPAFLMIVAMPFTYSISNGIAFGLVTYSLLCLIGWRWKERETPLHIVSAIIVVAFFLMH